MDLRAIGCAVEPYRYQRATEMDKNRTLEPCPDEGWMIPDGVQLLKPRMARTRSGHPGANSLPL